MEYRIWNIEENRKEHFVRTLVPVMEYTSSNAKNNVSTGKGKRRRMNNKLSNGKIFYDGEGLDGTLQYREGSPPKLFVRNPVEELEERIKAKKAQNAVSLQQAMEEINNPGSPDKAGAGGAGDKDKEEENMAVDKQPTTNRKTMVGPDGVVSSTEEKNGKKGDGDGSDPASKLPGFPTDLGLEYKKLKNSNVNESWFARAPDFWSYEEIDGRSKKVCLKCRVLIPGLSKPWANIANTEPLDARCEGTGEVIDGLERDLSKPLPR